MKSGASRHPYDTPLSSGLRFLSELIAWISGPWAISLVSGWLVLPVLALLVGLPSIFSTRHDKRNVVVATPGPYRVGIELLQYLVAMIAPWFVWPAAASGLAVTIVVASLVVGIPRIGWLLRGAPDSDRLERAQ